MPSGTLSSNQAEKYKQQEEARRIQLEAALYKEAVDRGLLTQQKRKDLIAFLESHVGPERAKEQARLFKLQENIERNSLNAQRAKMEAEELGKGNPSEVARIRKALLRKLDSDDLKKEIDSLSKGRKLNVVDKGIKQNKTIELNYLEDVKKKTEEALLNMPAIREEKVSRTSSYEPIRGGTKKFVEDREDITHSGMEHSGPKGFGIKLKGDGVTFYDIENQETVDRLHASNNETSKLREKHPELYQVHYNFLPGPGDSEKSYYERLNKDLGRLEEDYDRMLMIARHDRAQALERELGDVEDKLLAKRDTMRYVKNSGLSFRELQAVARDAGQGEVSSGYYPSSRGGPRAKTTGVTNYKEFTYRFPEGVEPHFPLSQETVDRMIQAGPYVKFHDGTGGHLDEEIERISFEIADLREAYNAPKILKETKGFLKQSVNRDIEKELNKLYTKKKDIEEEVWDEVEHEIAERQVDIQDLIDNGYGSDSDEVIEKREQLLDLLTSKEDFVQQESEKRTAIHIERIKEEADQNIERFNIEKQHLLEELKKNDISKEEFAALDEQLKQLKQETSQAKEYRKTLEEELSVVRMLIAKEIQEKQALSEDKSSYAGNLQKAEEERAARDADLLALQEQLATQKKADVFKRKKLGIDTNVLKDDIAPTPPEKATKSEYAMQSEYDPSEDDARSAFTELALDAQKEHFSRERENHSKQQEENFLKQLQAAQEAADREYKKNIAAAEQRHQKSLKEREKRYAEEREGAIAKVTEDYGGQIKHVEEELKLLQERSSKREVELAEQHAVEMKERDEHIRGQLKEKEEEAQRLIAKYNTLNKAIDEAQRDKDPSALEVLKRLRDDQLEGLKESKEEIEEFNNSLEDVGLSIHHPKNAEFKKNHYESFFNDMKTALEKETESLFVKKLLPKIHMASLARGDENSTTRTRIELAAAKALAADLEKQRALHQYSMLKEANNELREGDNQRINAQKIKAENNALHRKHRQDHAAVLQNLEKDITLNIMLADSRADLVREREFLQQEIEAEKASAIAQKEADGKKGKVSPPTGQQENPSFSIYNKTGYKGATQAEHHNLMVNNIVNNMTNLVGNLGSHNNHWGQSK